jgi:hypothetical protein
MPKQGQSWLWSYCSWIYNYLNSSHYHLLSYMIFCIGTFRLLEYWWFGLGLVYGVLWHLQQYFRYIRLSWQPVLLVEVYPHTFFRLYMDMEKGRSNLHLRLSYFKERFKTISSTSACGLSNFNKLKIYQ